MDKIIWWKIRCISSKNASVILAMGVASAFAVMGCERAISFEDSHNRLYTFLGEQAAYSACCAAFCR